MTQPDKHAAPPIITCKNLFVSFDAHPDVLSEISFDVAQGEHVCIMGGNGSGKSTLARCIAGLISPDRGTIIVCGQAACEALAHPDENSRVGIVFQNPDDQIVATIVEDDVAFGPENLGIPPREIEQRVADSLEMVGLAGFQTRTVHTLSGGQKQRLAIAGALALNPRILILDEASSMLDPLGREELARICKRLHNAGMTIVEITHFSEVAACADRIIALEDGRIIADNSPLHVFENLPDDHAIALPYALRVSRELQALGMPVHNHLISSELEEDICALLSSM